MNKTNLLVFDVGKTNVKLILLDNKGDQVAICKKKNSVFDAAPYPHFDIEGIWDWLVSQTAELAKHHHIGMIAISTHGAAAALVDIAEEKLLLPVMDYEFDNYPDGLSDYEQMRPDFQESFSPALPAGLNLGRQIHYQMKLISEKEREKVTLLFYPAYWAWRISGVATSEITSIGCHTDLWDVKRHDFSSLVGKLGLEGKIPGFVSPWQPVGNIRPEFAARTGLGQDCLVLPGIHDSNAGFLPYLSAVSDKAPTVVSTGTWVVAMSQDTPLSALDERADMLANMNAAGRPLATARYMGGREFEEICKRTGACASDTYSKNDIEDILSSNTMALPSFVSGAGPFPDCQGRIDGERVNTKALASLYSALMVDQLLTNLNSSEDIVIEGSFAANKILCSLIAALRPDQDIYINTDVGGISEGCFRLANWDKINTSQKLSKIDPFNSLALKRYAKEWADRI